MKADLSIIWKWVFVWGIAVVLIESSLLNTLHNNTCQLCRSSQLSEQAGSCPADFPARHWTCYLCLEQDLATLPYPASHLSHTISAAEMVANPQFQYQLTQLSATELRMYNPVLNLNLPISFDKLPTLSTPSPDSIIPQVYSQVDHELVPFTSFTRLWWNDTITATLPSLLPYNYQLEIYGQHDNPSPVYIRVSLNQQQIGLLSWELGDDTWSSKCLFLPASLLPSNTDISLNLTYLNDTVSERDAAIGWIRVIPVILPKLVPSQ